MHCITCVGLTTKCKCFFCSRRFSLWALGSLFIPVVSFTSVIVFRSKTAIGFWARAVQCDICAKWIHLICSSVYLKVFEFIHSKIAVNLKFICLRHFGSFAVFGPPGDSLRVRTACLPSATTPRDPVPIVCSYSETEEATMEAGFAWS